MDNFEDDRHRADRPRFRAVFRVALHVHMVSHEVERHGLRTVDLNGFSDHATDVRAPTHAEEAFGLVETAGEIRFVHQLAAVLGGEQRAEYREEPAVVVTHPHLAPGLLREEFLHQSAHFVGVDPRFGEVAKLLIVDVEQAKIVVLRVIHRFRGDGKLKTCLVLQGRGFGDVMRERLIFIWRRCDRDIFWIPRLASRSDERHERHFKKVGAVIGAGEQRAARGIGLAVGLYDDARTHHGRNGLRSRERAVVGKRNEFDVEMMLERGGGDVWKSERHGLVERGTGNFFEKRGRRDETLISGGFRFVRRIIYIVVLNFDESHVHLVPARRNRGARVFARHRAQIESKSVSVFDADREIRLDVISDRLCLG